MPEACSNLVPMQEWIKGSDPQVCRPCLLAPVTQWYHETLQGNESTQELGQALAALAESTEVTPEALCAQLDSIKEAVTPELRARLLDFDCEAQNYVQEGED